MSVDYKDMGKRIREIRESKHMTQAALSELAGIEPSNLSHIERAATKVSLPTLINIANALEVSLDELVCGSLVKSEHIAVRQLNELLSDCTPDELQAVIEMVKVPAQSHHEKPPEVTCTSRGNPGCPASTRKDLERPSSTRLEARVPSHGSGAMTRSPSPLAWRPDFPGAPREAH